MGIGKENVSVGSVSVAEGHVWGEGRALLPAAWIFCSQNSACRSLQQHWLFRDAEYINMQQRGSSLHDAVTVKVTGWAGRW
jgi:hypothetical protein